MGHEVVIVREHGWRRVKRHPRSCFTGCCCFLFVVFVVLVSVLRPIDDYYSLSSYAGEQYLLTESSQWYSSVTVSTTDSQYISTYYSSTVPSRIWQNSDYNFTASIPATASNTITYRAMYLPANSQLSVYFSAGANSVFFYVIEGTTDWTHFQSQGMSYTGHTQYTTYGSHVNYLTSVSSDNYYYIAWISNSSVTVNLAVTYSASRYVYDVSEMTLECSNTTYCNVEITDDPSYTIINAIDNPSNPTQMYGFTVSVSARTTHYWIIFGCAIAGWFLMICFFASCFAVLRRRRDHYEVISETTAINTPHAAFNHYQQPQPQQVYSAPPQQMYAIPPQQQQHQYQPPQQQQAQPFYPQYQQQQQPQYQSAPPPVNPQYQQPNAPPF